MDPRQRRSRDSLTRAVLELAAERPADAITVSELATAAGINRSTFYEHAVSPIGLLRDVLQEELEKIRASHLDRVDDPGAAIAAATAETFEHVIRHAEVYRRGLGEDSAGASLHSMLSAQFRKANLLLFDAGIVTPPHEDDLGRQLAAAFVADGTVGAIDVWLRTETLDTAVFIESWRPMLPGWWPWDAAAAS